MSTDSDVYIYPDSSELLYLPTYSKILCRSRFRIIIKKILWPSSNLASIQFQLWRHCFDWHPLKVPKSVKYAFLLFFADTFLHMVGRMTVYRG